MFLDFVALCRGRTRERSRTKEVQRENEAEREKLKREREIRKYEHRESQTMARDPKKAGECRVIAY